MKLLEYCLTPVQYKYLLSVCSFGNMYWLSRKSSLVWLKFPEFLHPALVLIRNNLWPEMNSYQRQLDVEWDRMENNLSWRGYESIRNNCFLTTAVAQCARVKGICRICWSIAWLFEGLAFLYQWGYRDDWEWSEVQCISFCMLCLPLPCLGNCK